MKKNPVDELFAKQLAEYHQEPSQGATERFQNRLKEENAKRMPVFWLTNHKALGYFGAAASVLLVVGFWFLSQKNEVIEPSKNVVINDKETAIKLNMPKQVLAQNGTFPTEKKRLRNKLKHIEKQAKTITIQKVEDSQVAENELITEQKNGEIPLPKIENELPKKEEIVMQIEAISTNEKEITTQQKEDLILVLSETKIANGEKIESPTAENESLIKRFLAQYKNFQNGEKVDFRFLKKSKEVIARADESLQEEKQGVIDSWQKIKNNLTKKTNTSNQ